MAAHVLDLPAADRLWWGSAEVCALWWGGDLVWGEAVAPAREDFTVAARGGSGLPEPFETRTGRLRTLVSGSTLIEQVGDDLLLWVTPAAGGLATNADGSGGTPPNDGPVGFVPNRFGSAGPLVQTTASRRPMLRQTEAITAIETNGVDQWMTVDGDFSGPELYLCAAVSFTRTGSRGRMFAGNRSGTLLDNSAAGLFALWSVVDGQLVLRRQSTDTASASHGAEPFVIELYMTATQSMVAINGVGAINSHGNVGAPKIDQIRIANSPTVNDSEAKGAVTLFDLVAVRTLPTESIRASLRARAADTAQIKL